jgi:hypothetical protein
MLLQPFVAAAILGRHWNWELAASLALILGGFLLREPATVLARQRWVWRGKKPESAAAARWLAGLSALVLLCLLALARALPLVPLAAIVSAGAGVTALAVWANVRSRQRAIPFQMASSVALGATALLGALAAVGGIPAWAWLLWLLLSLHNFGSILIVHLGLELRVRGGIPEGSAVLQAVYWVQGAKLVTASVLAALVAAPLAIPPVASAALNVTEAIRLRDPSAAREPLTRVGLRTLAASLVHTAVTAAVLA